MKFIIITLFPEMFSGILQESILSRAIENKLIDVHFVNLRDFGIGPRKQVDDTPYGGGAGMVLRVDVMAEAVKAAKLISPEAKVILMTPQGKTYNQEKANSLSKSNNDLIIVCGHYEGFDERIRALVDEEVSIGNFVLTGGEIGAMTLIDSVSRLLPGVLGKEASHQDESHSEKGRIEYPHYTRPENWSGQSVPDVLISGHHANIEKWREEQSKIRSQKHRDENCK
jgi:tRNA (guanine37-N1)-methyltransferase